MGIAIRNMFDGIARRYDFLNHFLSAGRDRAWRQRAATCLQGGPRIRVLDLCGGPGDFWKTWADQQPRYPVMPVGVIADFSLPMLLEARRKLLGAAVDPASPRPVLVQMDALNPCFKDSAFDAVLCAYGMRNLDSIGGGIEAIGRVLKPGGIFITLEFFRPTTAFTRLFYNAVAPMCIPLLGWFFSSRRQAYSYLVDSIRGFQSVWEYRDGFRQRGFRDVSVIPCDFGISHIVTAVKG